MNIEQVQAMQPNEKGIIWIGEKRYMKEVLLSVLNRAKKGKRIKDKTMVYGEHKRTAVIAMMPDGTEKEFRSQREAADELKINKSNIPKALIGKYKGFGGIRFKRA